MGDSVIIMEDIKKIYQMGSMEMEVLKGISLEVREKDFLAIMGPSGSGKSTFMNIIGCLDVQFGGGYSLMGRDVKAYDGDALARLRNETIGFIFQKFNLLPKLTAYENIELPLIYRGMDKKERELKVIEALEKVGLSDRAKHKPSEMSGGQQQRVAIARAIAGNPPVLLADEPTGNLDSKSTLDIMEIIADLNSSGNTIVMITHDQEIAEYAQKTIKINDGKIEG